jgi:hypothetical protein
VIILCAIDWTAALTQSGRKARSPSGKDDPIIALDFEDTLLGLGVEAVRSATAYHRSANAAIVGAESWA